MLKVDILKSFESISKDDWDKVLNASSKRSVFQTFGFQKAWWNNFGRTGRKRLMLLSITDGIRLVGIAPLFIGGTPVPVLRFIGAPVADYMDFISVKGMERAVCEVVYGFIKQQKIAMSELFFIPESGRQYHSGLGSVVETDAAPYIDLSEGWETFWAHTDKRLQKDLERCGRNLSQTCDVTYGKACSLEEGLALLPAYFDMHIRRWKDKAGRYSQFQSEVWQSFIRDAMKALFADSRIDLSYIKGGERFVAFHFGFIYEKRFYYYMPSYNPDFYRYSPSKLLIRHLIKRSCDEGLTCFDFLRGREPYKLPWADKEERLLSVHGFSDDPVFGAVGHVVKGIRDIYTEKIKPTLKKIRPLMKLWYGTKK